jgi:hypothetical protein
MDSWILRAIVTAVTVVMIAGCGGSGDSAADEAGVDAVGATENTADEVSTIDSSIEVHDVVSASTTSPSLVVRARATLAANIGAMMQLRVGGVAVASREIRATEFTDHTFTLANAVPAGARIDVVFTNNGSDSLGHDRNLYVDSVRVNGATLRPTDAGVTFDVGSGSAAFDGVNVMDGRGDLLWNGALRLRAPGDTLIVRARATLAANIGPKMQVRVDGVALATVEVKATSYADYRFGLTTLPSQRVDVVFTNDGSDSLGHNRNLYVDSARWSARTLHPTDSGALIDIGAGTAAFDGVNLIPGQSAILWNGALRMPVSSTAATAGVAQLGTTDNTTTTVTSPPPGAIDIRTTGARCDGVTDNSGPIATAIAQAKSQGVAVYIPPATCAYGDVIRLTSSVKLIGAGDTSVLYALNPLRESIYMYGSGSEVSHLKLAGRKATSRLPNFEGTRITLFGATNFLIDKVTIDGATGAGIQTSVNGSGVAANNGRITNSVIRNTLADSIHMTSRANYITVEGNRIEYSGDDGIAVVSYRRDGGLTHHITARNNVIVNNKGGRNMSVVGGRYVVYENNRMEGNLGDAACMYIAQEASYATYAAHDVTGRYNTLKDCGGAATGHGAVHIYSSGEEINTNITMLRNDVVQNGQQGMRVLGGSYNTGVRIDSNRITGASPALDIKSPGVTVIPYTSGLVGEQ